MRVIPRNHLKLSKHLLSKMLKFVIILAFPFCFAAITTDNLQSLNIDLLEAVDEVISSSFKSSAVPINFIMSLSDETKRNQSILINNLVARCDVVFIEDVEFINQRHRLYNVIFIDDFKSFLRLSQRMLSNNFVIDGYFLVVLVKGRIQELPEITKLLWSLFIHKIDFLVGDDNGTSLVTFLPFSKAICDVGKCEKRCDDSTPVVMMKTFNGSSNGNKNYFTEKVSNMFQCPVKVVTFNSPPMMMIRYDDNKNYNLTGPDGKMLKVLSEILNFKIDLIHISDLIR